MYAASIDTTTDDLERPFYASRAISAVAELLHYAHNPSNSTTRLLQQSASWNS